MIVPLLAAAFGGGAPLLLTDRAEIAVSRPVVTLGDVAGPGGAGRYASVAIARLPVGRDRLSLSRRAIASLVHRALPTLAVGAGDERIVTFHLVRRQIVDAPACRVTKVAVPAGTVIARDATQAGPCAAIAPGIAFDAARRVFVARRSLPAGSPLGPLVTAMPATVERGAAVTLVSRAGPVTIERSVTALQRGRDGRRVFVRDSQGHVFAAPVAGAAR